jgi:DegV family protein with EDD domain
VVVPHLVDFSGRVYREWVDIDAAAFTAKLTASNEIPKSIPAPVNDFVEALRPLVESGGPVICLATSRYVSQTFHHIQEAAGHFPGADIRIIDTGVTSSLLVTLALLAAEWAATGQSAELIERRVRDMIPNARIYFFVPTLDYLAKGGRIGGAAALLGSILQLKPILTLKDGRVDRHEMVRTHNHGMIKMQELALSHTTRDSQNHIVVTHAGVLAEAQTLAGDLQNALRLSKVPIYDIPPSIVCNTGPGTLGVSLFIDS